MKIKLKSNRAKAIFALIGLLALSATATAMAEKVQAGNVIIEIEGGITPTKLSKKTPTPITLKISGAVKDTEGTRPPALKTLDLEFDKHGMINTKGLATCNPSKLQATTTAAAEKACGKELVGKGTVSAEIKLPEEEPFSAGGPLLIFNGPPQGGKPVLVMQVYAHVPAATTFVTEGVIGKGSRDLRHLDPDPDPDDRRRAGLADLLLGHPPQDLELQGQEAEPALRDLPRRAPLRPRRLQLRRRHLDLGQPGQTVLELS